MRALLPAALLIASAAVSGCGGEASLEESEQSASSCGVERWAVKTATDALASSVSTTPAATSIQALGQLPVPGGVISTSAPRTPPNEATTFLLTNIKLLKAKLEGDSDYHLVLQDPATGATLIAEIPAPACLASNGRFNAEIAGVRSNFQARYSTVGTSFVDINATVTLTGIGFFDALHGQTGVAPNGFELHPVLSLCYGLGCAPGGADGGQDAGTAIDGGPAPDAGAADDGGPGYDAGSAGGDAGSMGSDAGSMGSDAGSTGSDAGAGGAGPPPHSGGCGTTGGAAFPAALAALLARRRRQRRPAGEGLASGSTS